MPDKVSESLVIILDVSRSMYRTDYAPNRLEACKTAIMRLMQARVKHDTSSCFGLVTVHDSADTLIDLKDAPDLTQMQENFREIKPHGNSAIGDGIGKAIKVLIEDIRISGARVPRMVLFSDGKVTKSQVDPMKMAQLAQQLSMKIDTFRIGEVEHINVMKRLSELTGGKYNYSSDASQLLNAAQDYGESNIEAHGAAYQKGKGDNRILKKIGAPLLTEEEMNAGSSSQQDLIAKLRGTKAYQKCTICFSDKDPITKGPFSLTGRYCPNCSQPIHLSCAGMWAKNNDKAGDGTVFRCPHCFYLLTIPASVQTVTQMHQDVKREIKVQKAEAPQEQYYTATEHLAAELGDTAMYNACPVCSGIFEEDDRVMKCGNTFCNGVYHKQCFAQLPDHRCKLCNTKLL
jgi:uncharacterized protein YegL